MILRTVQGHYNWVGGLDLALTQCTKYLGNEIIWADCFWQMISSMMGLHLAHIMNLITYTTKLPELCEVQFWGNVKSIVFTNVS